jgi:aminopeptidase N
MRRQILTAIKFSLVMMLSQGLSAQTVPGTGFDAQDYKLFLEVYIEKKSLGGHSIITTQVTNDTLSEFAFSAFDLPIDRAVVNGQKAKAEKREKALVIISPTPIKKGETAVIDISYYGQPKKGVIFGKDYAYSDYFACSWTPCLQDKPADKATFTLHINTSPKYAVQSIGTGKSVIAHIDDRYSWTSKTPFSNYLFSFAMGRFNRVELTPRLDVANLTDQTPDQVRALFKTTPDMVAFFEEKSGVPMPVDRYTQLLTPGDDAQEAATYSTIGLNQITPILKDPTDDWVIAHELAHLWWGNGVTCESWDHFWLNEGITSFMVAAWKEHRHGRAAYDAEMDQARNRVKRAANQGYDKPLTYAGPYPNLGTRRAIQYSKGALFMDALRRELGDDPFWKALRSYTRHYMSKTVNSRDFQRAFEDSSGRDLSILFKTWVYTA